MEKITDKRVSYVDGIMTDFIEWISSIKEVFHENELFIRRLSMSINEEMNTFVKNLKKDAEGKLILPSEKQNKAKKIIQRTKRVGKATEVVLPSSVVSMVSQFDSLIGGLIRAIHTIQPHKFKALGASLTISDILEYEGIEAIKEKVLDDKVENILRMSHEDQICELEKMLDNTPLTKFDYYDDFIEVTQRRNLFVHCNGKISTQYFNRCLKTHPENKLKCGDQLTVDGNYFDKAYTILYCLGVKLSQMVMRILMGKDKNALSQIDYSLNNVIFETINNEQHNIAITLSKFAIAEPTKHQSTFDRLFFVLNYAQALKWSGKNEQCLELLNKEDWSAIQNELLIAYYTLTEDYPLVYNLMPKIGKENDIIGKSAYRTWPIFQLIRQEEEFKNVFATVFEEDLFEMEVFNPSSSQESA